MRRRSGTTGRRATASSLFVFSTIASVENGEASFMIGSHATKSRRGERSAAAAASPRLTSWKGGDRTIVIVGTEESVPKLSSSHAEGRDEESVIAVAEAPSKTS